MKTIRFICVTMLLVITALSCASNRHADRGPVGSWDFSDAEKGTQGWELANSEFYQYHGSAKLSHDNTAFGKGLLRLDLDFSKDSDLEWSEPKMKVEFPKALNMKGKKLFMFDIYYNPELLNGGFFKCKVFSNGNGILIDSTGNAIEGGEDAGNGFVKQSAAIFIMPVSGFMTDLRFSIAGYLTDYKGPVFFNNFHWE